MGKGNFQGQTYKPKPVTIESYALKNLPRPANDMTYREWITLSLITHGRNIAGGVELGLDDQIYYQLAQKVGHMEYDVLNNSAYITDDGVKYIDNV